MFCRDTKTCRRTVVEYIDCEAPEADHFGKAGDDIGNVIEGVGELASLRHVRSSEAGQIGRHEMKAIGETGDEVAEHVARARETMEQQERRRVRRARLAVEDIDAIHAGGSVGDSAHCHSTL